jgi:hypothetical protein
LPTAVENQINSASLNKNAEVHASKTVSGYFGLCYDHDTNEDKNEIS